MCPPQTYTRRCVPASFAACCHKAGESYSLVHNDSLRIRHPHSRCAPLATLQESPPPPSAALPLPAASRQWPTDWSPGAICLTSGTSSMYQATYPVSSWRQVVLQQGALLFAATTSACAGVGRTHWPTAGAQRPQLARDAWTELAGLVCHMMLFAAVISKRSSNTPHCAWSPQHRTPPLGAETLVTICVTHPELETVRNCFKPVLHQPCNRLIEQVQDG